jgi:glycosyltransferase involved in cell wall biosynthesis
VRSDHISPLRHLTPRNSVPLVAKSDSPLPGWLFVLPWSLREIGGVNEVVKALIREFREDTAFSPRLLVTTEQPESKTDRKTEWIETDHLNLWSPIIREHPARGLISFVYRLLHRCSVLLRIINGHDIEVVNPHFPDLGCLVFVILRKLGLFRGALVLSFHLSDVKGALASTKIERKLWQFLLRGADRIVVVSDDLAKGVLTLDPTVAAKVTTIYNGVDLELFAPVGHDPCSDLGIPDQSNIILSVGAFIPRKGHEVLIRAFARVVRQISNAHLVLVGGSGSEIEPIQELIRSLRLTRNVTLFRDVPHESIPEFFRRAQVFVLASRQESFGLVVTEAGAAQVPVICTRAEGIRELVKDGVTGTLVDIDDDITLAGAILHGLREPDEAQKMALAFYEQVKNGMTWRHAYARYLQVAADHNPGQYPRSRPMTSLLKTKAINGGNEVS